MNRRMTIYATLLAAALGLAACSGTESGQGGDAPAVVLTAADGLPEVAPAEIGLTAAGVERLDSLMASYTAADRFPALMLMVARHGRIGYWKAAGVRDLETGERLDRNDVFRIYSITKPITAVAILMLWEEGKLNLDDPVSTWIPALADIRVYAGPGNLRPPSRPLTIRHLLTFNSGMSYGTFGEQTAADSMVAAAQLFERATDLDDLMRRLGGLPLLGDPGETFAYGFQTDVLGKVVEAVSGMPLDRFFQERIFAPLGMRETGFVAPGGVLGRYPTKYQIGGGQPPTVSDPGDSTSTWVQPLHRRTTFRFLSGGGGLVSTPSDYARFLQMLANRGELAGTRLLQAATVDSMTFAQVRTDSPRMSGVQGPGWAAGFQVMVAPDIAAAGGGGHDGLYWMSGAANLFVWVDPAAGAVAMVWAQAEPYQVYPLFADTRRAVAAALAQ